VKREPTEKPKPGEIRVVRRLLIEPTTLRLKSDPNKEMMRWLERATIQQVYRDGKWRDQYWINY